MSNTGTIPSGLRADDMRERMENKNLLNAKGALYVGTGGSETVNSNTIYETTALTVGANNTVLMADNATTNGLKYGLIGTGNIGTGAVTATKLGNVITNGSAVANGVTVSLTQTDLTGGLSIGITGNSTNTYNILPSGDNAINPLGRANGTVGSGSVAFGAACTALGTGSVALGLNAVSQGEGTIAIGYMSGTGAVSGAISIGSQSGAIGECSIAIGDNAVCYGANAAQIGGGTNSDASTLKFSNGTFNKIIVDSNGKINADTATNATNATNATVATNSTYGMNLVNFNNSNAYTFPSSNRQYMISAWRGGSSSTFTLSTYTDLIFAVFSFVFTDDVINGFAIRATGEVVILSNIRSSNVVANNSGSMEVFALASFG